MRAFRSADHSHGRRGEQPAVKPVGLTEGKSWSQILRFMLPMLLGNITQQLCAWTFGMIYSYYLYRKGKWRARL